MSPAIDMIAVFTLAMDAHGVTSALREEIIDTALRIAIERSPVPTVYELPMEHVQ